MIPDRWRAAAGALGVVLLTSAWVVSGLLTEGFDPVRQSNSQLQRDGTATGVVLTAAFVAFATGALLVAPVVGRRLARAPQAALTLAALATLGAAVSPLGQVRGGTQDGVHLSFGATGYVSLSVLPLLAAWALRHRSTRAMAASAVLGVVACLCLLGTVPADAVSGALQRIGFLAGHLWVLGFCVVVLRQPQEASLASASTRWRGRRSA